MCKPGFNRRLISNLHSAEAEFVCVGAVSTAVSSSFRGGGIRLCRRGFNRRLIFIPRRRNSFVSARFQPPSNLHSAEAEFVCVGAVSTAVSSLIFIPRRRNSFVSARFQPPSHLHSAEAEFVCVGAVSTAVSSLIFIPRRRNSFVSARFQPPSNLHSSFRGGGIRLCRRGFNRRLILSLFDYHYPALSSACLF